MLAEMVEYLALNQGYGLEWNTDITSPLRNDETGCTKDCGKNDEVCQMLDELERELLIKKDSEPTSMDENQSIKKETPQEEGVRQEGNKEDDIEKKTDDDNGFVTKLPEAQETRNEEPKRLQKHRHLSIFTKRRKTKPLKVENEDNLSTSSEKKAKKEKSKLKRFRNLFWCCFKTEN